MDAEKMTPSSTDDQVSLDPVHPGAIRPGAAATRPAEPHAPRAAAPPRATAPRAAARRTSRTAADRPAQRRRTQLADRPPRVAELGYPAVLDHELVAIDIADSATPITVTRWFDGRPQTAHMRPLHAVVWARAGRVTLVGADDASHRLTLLAEDEYGEHRIGEHWPLGEPEGRAKRVAAATLRDLGDVLTFPVWLVHSSHTSGERNAVTKRFLRRLTAVSPDTVIHHNQTFGTPPAQPGQLRPYDHRGLVGQEGYPKEL